MAFLGVMALLLCELAVRLATPGARFRLINEISYDGIQWKQVNRSYLEKYFPASSAMIPEFKPTIVRATKPARGIRVLCVGESSMFGTPYHAGGSIPDILRKQLRRLFPDREIEVVNLGASALNTNAIRDFCSSTLELEPDLVLVYTGHNEFYGPDGVGASALEKMFPPLVRAKYALRDLRLLRLIQGWLRSFWLTRDENAEQNLMRQVSAEAYVRLASDDAERVFLQFEENLTEILATYRRGGIPVVVSDVASNLLFPPFACDSVPALKEIPRLVGSGQLAEARELLRSVTPDTGNAFIAYWGGRLALGAGDSVTARHLLARARDEDLLKFRAPDRTNRIIRAVCRKAAVPLLSADSLLSPLGPGKIAGENLFWEHVHLRAKGYYLIADLFLRALIEQKILPPGGGGPSPIPFHPDSLSICWLDRAIADLSVRAITSRWPFREYTVAMEAYPFANSSLQAIARDVYGRRVNWNDGALRSAEVLRGEGKRRDAQTTYEAILEEYPRASFVRYQLAVLLKESGALTPAAREYALAIALNPEYPFPRVDLGLLLINEGRLDEAEIQLRRGLDLAQSSGAPATLTATALYGLSAVAANRGDFAEALRLIDESLRLAPSYEPARSLRSRLADMGGR